MKSINLSKNIAFVRHTSLNVLSPSVSNDLIFVIVFILPHYVSFRIQKKNLDIKFLVDTQTNHVVVQEIHSHTHKHESNFRVLKSYKCISIIYYSTANRNPKIR